MTVERTLAIIKPDAWAQRGGAILTMGTEAGLVPVEAKVAHVMPWHIFYGEHQGKPFFKPLVEFMSSGPSLAMVLVGEGAVAKWRALMGPTDSRKAGPETIRGRYGEADPEWCEAGGRRKISHTWEQLTLYVQRCVCCSAMRHDVEKAVADYPMWRNAVHGSDSVESAAREINFFFGGA